MKIFILYFGVMQTEYTQQKGRTTKTKKKGLQKKKNNSKKLSAEVCTCVLTPIVRLFEYLFLFLSLQISIYLYLPI